MKKRTKKTCPMCGSTLQRTNYATKYCSTECYSEANRIRMREKYRASQENKDYQRKINNKYTLKDKTYIYSITNKITGKVYVGQTKNLKTRMSRHFTTKNYKKLNNSLYEDIKKYGKDNFVNKILQVVNNKEANKYERKFIEESTNTYNVNKPRIK